MSETEGHCNRLQRDTIAEIGYNEDLVLEILSRLPAKTVVQCKLVAKHWLRLISEPNFPRMHLNWCRKNLKYIICPYREDDGIVSHLSLIEEDGIIRDIPLPGFHITNSSDVICFTNGLACCIDFEGLDDVHIRIFNPITQEVLVLPRGSPSKKIPLVGIAIHPETGGFKAFRFFSYSSGEYVSYKCEAYTHSSGAWRRISEDIEHPDFNPYFEYCSRFVSVGGAMYWLVWSKNGLWMPLYILSVDLNDNFRKIDSPRSLDRWSCLIELEGCLSLIYVDIPDFYESEYEDEDPKANVEVYILKEHGWVCRAKFTMGPMDIHDFTSVAALNSELFFILKLSDELYHYLIYDLNQKTLRTLDLQERLAGCSPIVFPFAETLVKCDGR